MAQRGGQDAGAIRASVGGLPCLLLFRRDTPERSGLSLHSTSTTTLLYSLSTLRDCQVRALPARGRTLPRSRNRHTHGVLYFLPTPKGQQSAPYVPGSRAEWAKNERSRACGGDAGWDETALDTQIHPSLCAAIRSAAPPGVHSTKTTTTASQRRRGEGGSGSRGRGRQGEAVTGRQGGKEKG